jgi:hypothetical protein
MDLESNMKLGRLNHTGVAALHKNFVIASVARQSSVVRDCSGLLRRFAPRNDGGVRFDVRVSNDGWVSADGGVNFGGSVIFA